MANTKFEGLSESRIQSLYKDFRSLKTLNPDGYFSNLNTWKNFLQREYFENHRRILQKLGSSFLQNLSRDDLGPPKSLDVVIDSLVRERIIVPIDIFKLELINDVSWWRSWSRWRTENKLKKYTSRVSEEALYLNETQYVILPLLEKLSSETINCIHKRISSVGFKIYNAVYSVDHFFEALNLGEEWKLDAIETDIVLSYLELNKGVLIHDDNLVKILGFGNLNASKSEITDIERHILDVKNALHAIDKQIVEIQRELKHMKAAENAEEFKKQPAKVRIESKKSRLLITKYLVSLFSKRTNIIAIKTKILESHDNLEMMTVLKNSNDTLKSINAATGTLQQVHEMIEDFKDSQHDNDLIGIMLGNSSEAQVDDAEIDIELEKLEGGIQEESKYLNARNDIITGTKTNSVADVEQQLGKLELTPSKYNASDEIDETAKQNSQKELNTDKHIKNAPRKNKNYSKDSVEQKPRDLTKPVPAQ